MDKVQIHISIPKPLYDRLVKLANAKYRTLTSVIIEALLQLVDDGGY